MTKSIQDLRLEFNKEREALTRTEGEMKMKLWSPINSTRKLKWKPYIDWIMQKIEYEDLKIKQRIQAK